MAAEDTWPCSWLIAQGRDEDGEEIIVECGATTHIVGAGWRCDAGHQHLGIEVELAPFGPEWQREQRERGGRL